MSYVIQKRFIIVIKGKLNGHVVGMGIARIKGSVLEGIRSHACVVMIYGDRNVSF